MMHSSFLLSQLVFGALALATPHSLHTRTSSIQWTPCTVNSSVTITVPIECASLAVPLDYTNTLSKATLDLELLRVPHLANSEFKGSILTNFGGPGASGQEDLAVLGDMYQAFSGGRYDIVTVVPRGTGNTIPFSCYATAAERAAGAPSLLGNASDVADGQIWAESTVFVETCAAVQNVTGEFVGTAFVARDFMAVVDALGEDGLLRYWGISYGTVLGATLAAMFPEKVDKMIIDGVVNAHEYYQNKEVELYTSTDAVLRGLLLGCADAPQNCSLAHNLTGPELERTMQIFLEDLKYNPLPVYIPGVGGAVITYSQVKAQIVSILDTPSLWPTFAIFLDALLQGNVTAIIEYVSGKPATELNIEGQYGIKCSDVLSTGISSYNDSLAVVDARHAKSRWAGDSADHLVMRCAQWQLPARERFSGSFLNITTKNPVLVIGNTYDPVTPFVSAQNMSMGLEGSVVLRHDGYGHCITGSQASLCTAKAILAYWNNGTLPEPGTICGVDVPLFSGENGWDRVIAQVKESGN